MENTKESKVWVVNFFRDFDRLELKETRVFREREEAVESANSWEDGYFNVATLKELTVE